MSNHEKDIVFSVHGLELKLPPTVGSVHGQVSLPPGGTYKVTVKRDPVSGRIVVTIEK